MLLAVQQDAALQTLCEELVQEDCAWQLSAPDGVKVFVDPCIYPDVLNFLRGTRFRLGGQLVELHQLKRWHIIVGEEHWPNVRDAMSSIDHKHKVKLKWRTDLLVPLTQPLELSTLS